MWKAVSCCSLSGYAHMVSTTAANMAEQVRRDERADQRLVERVIEGALAGVGAMGLREYLAAAARRDVDEADSLSSDPSSPHRQRPSSSSPSVPDPSSPSVPSLVQILERFADAGGIERARKVTRGHEEVIRLGIEHLKNEALETLEALAAGGYASKPLSMDEYRALELTRRACVSVLRLNPFPTRRDSYTDERGPRLSSEREGAHRGGAEARRGWDDFVAPFPVGEDARVCGFDGKTHGQNVRATDAGGVVGGAAAGRVERHVVPGANDGAGDPRHVACASSHDVRLRCDHATQRRPLAPGFARGSNVAERVSAKLGADDSCARDRDAGSARGSNVVGRPSAKMPADDGTGDTHDREARDRGPMTIGSSPRDDPPAEPGANGAGVDRAHDHPHATSPSKERGSHSHGQNVRATANARATRNVRATENVGFTASVPSPRAPPPHG